MSMDPEAVVRKFWEFGNKHDLDGLFKLIAPEIKSDYFSGPVNGKEFFVRAMTAYARAFPDSHDEIRSLIVQNDAVGCEYVETATFKGPLETQAGLIQPTGRRYSMPVSSFFRVNGNGLITEMRNYFNMSLFLQQTGLDLSTLGKATSAQPRGSSDFAEIEQRNMSVIKTWIEAHNRQDVEGALVFFDDDIEIEEIPTGVKYKGIDSIREMARVAYSSQGYKVITNLFASKDWACVEYDASANLTEASNISGPSIFGNIQHGVSPPTGKQTIEMKVCYLAHFNQKGKMDRVREYWDSFSVLTQMGINPQEVLQGGANMKSDSGNNLESGTNGHSIPTGQESVPRAIRQLEAKFSDPGVQKSMEGFTQTLQVSFTDLGENYVFTIEDGKLSNVEKKSLPNAGIVITVSSTVLDGILIKKSNPMVAYMTGKLRMKGSREDLTRLQKIMN